MFAEENINNNSLVKYRRCIIVSGSPVKNIARLESCVTIDGNDLIIACDSGYSHALRLGLKPHIVVGDFDSYRGNIDIDAGQKAKTEIVKTSPEKDDTDTMMAVKMAMERGIRELILIEALGGRLDHTLANIAAAVYVKTHGGECRILSDENDIYILMEELKEFDYPIGTVASIFSYSDVSCGVTYSGLKYELLNYELKNEFPLGISNEFISTHVTMEVKKGILIVMINKKG